MTTIKTFKHELLEECRLCHKVINTEKDDWVVLIDLKGIEIVKVKFYHRFCLTDLINGQGRVIAKNFEEKVKQTIGALLKGIGGKEVYEIKN